ncbi:23S rRNA (adenine(1618)-N(6))-methyltransferase RlmF [Agaribacterium sp. ZY112]|uniref:23S rRNA (adenine(1618)-N(6))-methyltransferase RlmF n=1 Tax=Agaribacterium sp. ZY112 TaxID=3233574 RepID=UPI0035263839
MPKPIVKSLHKHNLHKHGYDFPLLTKAWPALKAFVKPNANKQLSIDFADAKAVVALNAALLKHYYHITYWDIPKGYLCPPIPGRVDYIHHAAELVCATVSDKQAGKIKMLDIGTGANGIYALLASQVYSWHCVGSDVDPLALDNLDKIIKSNKLHGGIETRLQANQGQMFKGVIQPGEYYQLSVCNPPFHSSLEEALKGNKRKQARLEKSRKQRAGEDALLSRKDQAKLNFGGQKAELWCKGGEQKFLRLMIKESKDFAGQCRWFTSLVSKSENLKAAHKLLKKLAASDIREIEMRQGNKITRILAWSFS